MMNVLHIYKAYYPDSVGGVEEGIRQICNICKIRGVNSRILVLTPGETRKELIDGIEVSYVKQIANIRSCPIGGVEAFREMSRLDSWSDINVLHFPWPFGDLLLLSTQAKKNIILYHSDIVRQRILKILYSPLMSLTLCRATKIIATSPNYANTSDILKKYKDKIEIIPPVSCSDVDDVNVEEIRKFGLRPFEYVLSLGVNRYYKGYKYLIEASDKIKRKVVIAGKGTENLQLKQRNHKNIVLLGGISKAEKNALVKFCKIFILPSIQRSEAFGLVLAEASYFGKPLISCELGTGTSWVNTDQETGFVVKPQDVDALARATNELIDNPDKAKRYGECAKLKWNMYFSPEVLSGKWINVFNRVR